LYSYSFELKPDWTRKYALREEIADYFCSVAEKHDIPRHTSFFSVVQKAEFNESTGTWVVTILNQKTGRLRQRRCRVLISAVGALSVPNECEIKGAEDFKGKIFHSSQWDHSFDWADKEVVVVGMWIRFSSFRKCLTSILIMLLGNGCSATQFVPVMSEGKGKVRQLTQFSRQPHWLAERPNPIYSPLFKYSMKYVPLAMRMYRFWQYFMMEKDFFAFRLESGRKLRAAAMKERTAYMKRTAPQRYHEALTPKIDFGCKRNVMDTDYFECLHRENVELIHSDPIREITETGVRTESGKEVNADAIVLANGFQTQQVLYPLEIRGENGISLNDHVRLTFFSFIYPFPLTYSV
jgi:cation diffusion facilitator CzcD-associated flavoprotein CzcO